MKFYISNDVTKGNANPSTQHVEKWCDAWEVDRTNGDCERCPICGRPISMLKWLEPRKIRLTSSKYPDRLTSWLTEPMVIAGKVKKAYEQEGLTGIREFIPVSVTKVANIKNNSPKPPDYFCAEIDFTMNVWVDVDKSDVLGQEYDWSCALCNPWGTTIYRINKLVLDTSEWKGEDIFKVFLLGTVVSQRFYDLVQKGGFTNFNLVPVEEYCIEQRS